MALRTSLGTPITGTVDYVGISQHTCPICNGQLLRTRRRAIDRLSSLFVPVHRYRCQVFSCQWVGNFGTQADGAGSGVERPVAKKPMSFVVHMVLAATGLAVVLVLTTTDWFSERNLASNDAPDSHLKSAALIGRATALAPARDQAGESSQAPSARVATRAR